MWSTVLCVLVLSEQTGMKSQNSGSSNDGIQGRQRDGMRSTTVLDILIIKINKDILSGQSVLAEKLLWKVLNPSWRQQGSVTALFQGCSSRGFL